MSKQFLKNNLLLILIILLASFFRLYRIDGYMEFLGDQGRDVVIISNFLKKGDLFFIGPQTSIGNMYLGPYYYYLIAPSLLLANFNPVGPAIFIALLGVLTVYLIYRISLKWFNPFTAYSAAFLYAISPVAIKYSDFSWNPNIMPLFALLFIYFFTEAVFSKKYNYLIFASLSFIFAINSHYLALLLLPVAGLLWLYRLLLIRKNTQELRCFLSKTLLSVLIFILSLTPQIIFDLKHHGQNIQAILHFFTYRETTVSIKPYKAIPEMIPLLNMVTSRLLAGKNTLLGSILSITLIALSVFSLGYSYIRRKANPYLIVSFLWLFIGILGMGLYKQHVYDHYFGFIYPVIFIIPAYFLSILFSRKNLLSKAIALILVIIVSVFSFIENPFRYSPNNQLYTTQLISESIQKDSNGQPFNLALLAKQNYDPPYRYFLTLNHAPVYDLHDKLADQLYVICEPFQMDCQPINNPLWEIAAFGWSKIDKQWQIGDIKLFRLVHTQ